MSWMFLKKLSMVLLTTTKTYTVEAANISPTWPSWCLNFRPMHLSFPHMSLYVHPSFGPGVVKGMASDHCTGQVPADRQVVCSWPSALGNKQPPCAACTVFQEAGDGWCWAKSCMLCMLSGKQIYTHDKHNLTKKMPWYFGAITALSFCLGLLSSLRCLLQFWKVELRTSCPSFWGPGGST